MAEYKTVAIDADLLVYKCSAIAQHVFYDLYDEDGELIQEFNYAKDVKDHIKDAEEFHGLETSGWKTVPRLEIGEFEEARKALDHQVKKIKKALPADSYKLYLTGKGNYREGIARTLEYKGNRKDMEKPHWFNETKQYILDEHKAIVVKGNEADDACGVIAYKGYKERPKKPTTVSASLDKDITGVPGYHYNWDREELILVTEEEADRMFYTQLLCGDKSTDNIPGCEGLAKSLAEKHSIRKSKGLGVKGAEALLADCKTPLELYQRCVEAYTAWYSEQDGWDRGSLKYKQKSWDGENLERTIEEIIKEQAYLLWIQREKGKMWEAPHGT